MTIGERLKLLRKTLGLNQNEVASKLCIVQAHVSAMEKGIRDITDRTISDLCREYGVSEEWLREGTGDMFAQVPTSAVSGLAAEYNLDQFDQALIEEYLKLDPASKLAIKEYIRKVYLASDEEAAIKEEVAAYEQELREQKRETLSDTESSNAKEA